MKIVFLHGIGTGDPEFGWLDGLDLGLINEGWEPVDRGDVIAPRYSDFLSTDGITAKIPPITYKGGDEATARFAFERRQAHIRRLIDDVCVEPTGGFSRFPAPVVNTLQHGAVRYGNMQDLDQVRRYVTNEGMRGAVLTRVLHELRDLPSGSDILLIGHSLGSVIAIDLLDHLRPDLHVRRFITIGSPASSPALHDGSERLLKRFPYTRVDDWTNFLNTSDHVTGGRGLGVTFPAAQDFAVQIGLFEHSSGEYLAQQSVARLVADLLHPSADVVAVTSGVAIRLTAVEASALLVLHYAEAVAASIKDKDTASRYRGALRTSRDDVAARLAHAAATDSRPVAPEVAALAGPDALPLLPQRWELREVVGALVALSVTDPVSPCEIDVDKAPLAALPAIADALGVRRDAGTTVGRAITEVDKYVNKRDGTWGVGRIATVAAGVALVAAAPIGLAVAAPAALFGAAALTSGLAAFGPGGMIGGLAMLGGLASTGAAVAATGVAAGGDEAPVADSTTLTLRVATEYAHSMLDLPIDRELWYLVAEAETRLSGEINKLAAFSDPKSPGLTQLRAARTTVTRLLAFMIEKGLSPRALEQGDPNTPAEPEQLPVC